MEKQITINKKDWRIILISLITVIAVIIALPTILWEIWVWEIPFIPKIMILLMSLLFIWEKIIARISTWLVKLFEGLTLGKGLKTAFDDTLEKETEEK